MKDGGGYLARRVLSEHWFLAAVRLAQCSLDRAVILIRKIANNDARAPENFQCIPLGVPPLPFFSKTSGNDNAS